MTAASAAQIGAIHVIAKALGMTDAERRDLMAGVCGKRSASQLTAGEAVQVVGRLQALRAGGKSAAHTASGRYAPKLRALWLSGWALGVVRDPSDAAMLAFVATPSQVDHARFLDTAAANRAIEAIKGLLAREAGVIWPAGKGDVRASRLAVLAALRRRLEAARADVSDLPSGTDLTDAEIDRAVREGGARLRRHLTGGAR